MELLNATTDELNQPILDGTIANDVKCAADANAYSQQRLPSRGVKDDHKVNDPGFYEPLYGFSVNCIMETTARQFQAPGQALNEVPKRIPGNNSGLNPQSLEHDARVMLHIGKLHDEVEALPVTAAMKEADHEVISKVADELKRDVPRKAVIGALLSSLPHAVSIVVRSAHILSLV